MLETLFNFHLANWPGVLLALGPMLLNIGIAFYVNRRLPRDQLTVIFQLFLASLVLWQLYDVMVRLASTAETAMLWRGYLRSAQILSVPLGLHFALLYANRERVTQAWAFWVALYLPSFVHVGAYQARTIEEQLFYTPGWGWLSESQNLGLVHDLHSTWLGLMALLTCGILVHHAWRTRHVRTKNAGAALLAMGIGIPTVIGVIGEVVLPLLGLQQWPITSTVATLFSVFTLLGLLRYQLFSVSTPAAAKAVLETITDTLLIARADGQLLFANHQAALQFGLDREQVQNHHLKALFPNDADALAFFAGRWKDTLRGARFDGLEARLCTAKGDTPFLMSLAPIPITRQGEPGVVVVAHDVTRMKAYESELEAAKEAAEFANRTKSLFLANMSHELRTPLNAIIGYAELLEEDSVDPAAVEDLSRIRRSGRYLLKLINDILDLSKVESGKLEVQIERVHIGDLIASVNTEIEQLATKHGNTHTISIEGPHTHVLGDRTRLQQVLHNLISNAMKFTENGLVSVSVTTPGDRVRISIEDSGIGMDDTQLSALFGLFSQVHKGDREKYGGTGLGLALSRRLCQVMEGDIEVSSTPDVGTTFTVDLPAAP